MKNTININKGATNVKRENIIDFDTIDTKDREDDFNTWNSMQLYGEDDAKELAYESKKRISKDAAERIKSRKIGYTILGALKAA